MPVITLERKGLSSEKKRWPPEDIAGAVLFYASDETKFITEIICL